MDDQDLFNLHDELHLDPPPMVVKPEFNIALPKDFSPEYNQAMFQRAKNYFRTYEFLVANGLKEPNPEDPADRDYIAECMREAAKQFVGDPTAKKRPMNAETVKWTQELLDRYQNHIVEDTIRLRNYVKTRLLEESNPDRTEKASDRLKALESLGKLSDLGMFKDTVEVNVNTKSTEELKEELVRRLSRYMGAAQIVDTPTKQQRKSMIIDLDKALGKNNEQTQEQNQQ